ncbi:MAG: helix-turn-helix domain-containing protein [Pedobacter sp.]|nr:MAG: helix-turn-helix domain-containing protein [Pedobacter sp.]
MYQILKKSPHPALKQFVKEYWYLYTSRGNPNQLSNTPTPEEAIYFYPKNKPAIFLDGKFIETPDTVIIRQQTKRIDMLVPNDYLMFKIIFKTGGFHRLFGIPLSLFSNGHIDTICVLGNPIKELNEQILNSTNFEDMVLYAEKYLMNKASNFKIKQLPIDFVINQAQLYKHSLGKLASDACLSNRQFERNFIDRTGVTPKIYQRILKFNQAMKFKKDEPNQTWTSITHSVGYFDQMHLLRDFKQFTDTIPTIFDFDNAIIY